MINDAVAIVVFEIMNSDEVFGDPCDHQTVQSVPLVTRDADIGHTRQRGKYLCPPDWRAKAAVNKNISPKVLALK